MCPLLPAHNRGSHPPGGGRPTGIGINGCNDTWTDEQAPSSCVSGSYGVPEGDSDKVADFTTPRRV